MDDFEYSAELERLMDLGVVTIEGVDENGEFIYALHEDAAKKSAPEVWEQHSKFVDDALMELYTKGLAEIEYDEDLEATVHLSDEGYKIAKQMGIIPLEMPDDEIPND